MLQGMENLVKDDDCIACLFYVLEAYHLSIYAILNILPKDSGYSFIWRKNKQMLKAGRGTTLMSRQPLEA